MRSRSRQIVQVPEEPKLTIERLSQRWRLPAYFVRYELKRAGIRLIQVPRKPVDGARLSDVLAFEQQVREGIISSGIRPNSPKDAPPLRVIPNPKAQEEAGVR
jgi:hypothetical protein